MPGIIRMLCVSSFIILVGCGHAKPTKSDNGKIDNTNTVVIVTMQTEDFEPEPYRVVFTPIMTLDNKPAKDVKEMSINEKQIYIHVMWLLPVKKHEAMVKMFDGAGNQVHSTKQIFFPKTKSWNMTAAHLINRDIEVPGEWRFVVYMDGKLKVEKTLKVVSN